MKSDKKCRVEAVLGVLGVVGTGRLDDANEEEAVC